MSPIKERKQVHWYCPMQSQEAVLALSFSFLAIHYFVLVTAIIIYFFVWHLCKLGLEHLYKKWRINLIIWNILIII